MKSIQSTILVLAFYSVFNCLNAQDNKVVDTVNLYESRASVSLKYWNLKPNNFSFSYKPFAMTKQDSMIQMKCRNGSYFTIIYDIKNNKVIEGYLERGLMFSSDVRIYHKGQLARIETYGVYHDSKGNYLHDGYAKKGLWSYFRENGQLKKTVEYTLAESSNEFFIKQVTKHYDKTGKKVILKSEKKIDIHSKGAFN